MQNGPLLSPYFWPREPARIHRDIDDGDEGAGSYAAATIAPRIRADAAAQHISFRGFERASPPAVPSSAAFMPCHWLLPDDIYIPHNAILGASFATAHFEDAAAPRDGDFSTGS